MAYTRVLTRLRTWLGLSRLPAWNSAEWDDAAVEFLEWAFDQEISVYSAARCLSALKRAQPQLTGTLKQCFPGAMQALLGWRRLHPPWSRPPVPRIVAYAIARQIDATGARMEAFGMLLLFECYLRPSELLRIEVSHVVASQRAGELPSKTCEYDCTVPFGLTRHKWIGNLVMRLAKLWRPRERLWDFTYERLRAFLRQAVVTLELEALAITPRSFRHGGASHDRRVAERSLL